jgi:hypothetical protein
MSFATRHPPIEACLLPRGAFYDDRNATLPLFAILARTEFNSGHQMPTIVFLIKRVLKYLE